MTATRWTPLLRIGIAGLGQAGNALLLAVRRTPYVRVTAVADLRPDLRDAFARDWSAAVYPDVDALCSDPSVDLVYIATPTHLHTAHVLTALAHGRHVIVEKPMALTLADAATMIDAARRAGRHLIVGHSQSFEPPVQAMRTLVECGAVGPLRMVHTWYYTDWLYRPRRPEELDTTRGGGALFRQGAHHADLLRWIAGGRVRSVRAWTGNWDPARPTEGSYVLFLDFEDGVVATAVFSGYDHFHSTELTFGFDEHGRRVPAGSHGRARAALRAAGPGGEAALKDALGYGRVAPSRRVPSFYGLTVVSGERGDVRQTPRGLRVYEDERAWDLPVPARPDGREILLREAYDAVAHDRPPPHDGRWGMANLEVCLAALESARGQHEVRLHHQVPLPERTGGAGYSSTA
jgi:phthalate 4,5-cis-dihydrodiol dehydrogenase